MPTKTELQAQVEELTAAREADADLAERLEALEAENEKLRGAASTSDDDLVAANQELAEKLEAAQAEARAAAEAAGSATDDDGVSFDEYEWPDPESDDATTCYCEPAEPMAPGKTISRWGIEWTAREDGRLEAEVPNYAVRSGVEAGRYAPEGLSTAEVQALIDRRTYTEIFGSHPDPSMTDDDVARALVAHYAKQAKSDRILAGR